MSSETQDCFIESLLRAPAGVALLGRLEFTQRQDLPRYQWKSVSDPAAVQRASTSVASMAFGELVDIAVFAAEQLAGPWSGEALLALPYLYQQAIYRRPIAEAVSETFFAELHRGADFDAQQWWNEDPSDPALPVVPRFTELSSVYGNGEFTRSGLWTVTDPPLKVHDALTLVWDFCGRPTSRWLIPVRPDARVWNIDGPDDWARLVERYPRVAPGAHSGWELPGPNQHPNDTQLLRSLTTQHAVKTEIADHVLPDWASVVADFDGVHLSWAGFLTSEGYISDLSAGGVTMLRYWGSERTLWLRDVFDEPKPLTGPALTGRVGSGVAVDASANAQRRTADRSVLEVLLGRSGHT